MLDFNSFPALITDSANQYRDNWWLGSLHRQDFSHRGIGCKIDYSYLFVYGEEFQLPALALCWEMVKAKWRKYAP